jgi:hypothetical protein
MTQLWGETMSLKKRIQLMREAQLEFLTHQFKKNQHNNRVNASFCTVKTRALTCDTRDSGKLARSSTTM